MAIKVVVIMLICCSLNACNNQEDIPATAIHVQSTPQITWQSTKDDSQMLPVKDNASANAVSTPKSSASTPVLEETQQAYERQPEMELVKLRKEISFGVYDPQGTFSEDEDISIENIFLPWRLNDASEVLMEVHETLQKGRFPLLTLEPWPWEWNGMTKKTLFSDIISGKYDSSIVILCQELGKLSPQKIWIRWGHEMELTSLFVWAQGDPSSFIEAYRHFVQLCRSEADNLEYVWSPAGGEDSLKYWPGEKYVDYIGVTVVRFEESSGQSFNDIFGEKYHRMERYDLPIIISEMGVDGASSLQTSWIEEAMKSLPQYNKLKAVVYFNSTVESNQYGIRSRDYRITPDLFP